MRDERNIVGRMDWVLVLIYLALVLIGWLVIYSTNYDEESSKSIFDLSLNSGKQFIRIVTCLVIAVVIMTADFRFYESLGYVVYGLIILLLIFVLIFGREVAGSKSWFEIGSFKLQPSEFAKFATALALGKLLSTPMFKLDNLKNLFMAALVIGIPVGLIMLQGDTGTSLVFVAFAIPLYREGLNPAFIIIGLSAAVIFILTLFVPEWYLIGAVTLVCILLIAFGRKGFKRIAVIVVSGAVVCSVVFAVDYIIEDVMKPHQQNRVKALINPESDPLGYGWNVTQSKIAIGSGGLWGKGYLSGTQTKFDFVPEQTTDFIFCTVGEEAGWIGSFLIVALFVIFLVRLVNMAERQKSKFARVYGYSVAAIFFFHFMVNIGMTIGYFPVIGIPLPFLSYGGSSLWAFTILLFIFLKLDAHKMQILTH